MNCFSGLSSALITSGYATWFTAGGAIRIAHYDVIDDVVTETIRDREKRRPHPHEILWAIHWWKPHRSTTTFAKPEMKSLMTS